jgi:mono/diheme cytochrome c family protein
VFDEKDCITCHSEDGSHGDDGIPPITGPYFMTRWDGESIGDIYAFIAENMPRTKPGSLMPEDIADVIAYLLKLNELPAGPAPLSAEAVMLKTVMFTETAPAR